MGLTANECSSQESDPPHLFEGETSPHLIWGLLAEVLKVM